MPRLVQLAVILPLAVVVTACVTPAGARPTHRPMVRVTANAPTPAHTPTPAASGQREATPAQSAACATGLVAAFREAFEADSRYAYRAAGWNEFKLDGRRDEQRIRSEAAFEGARAGEIRWWRRIAGGLELHDEAVADGAWTWLRLPLSRSWQEDREGEASPPDPLAELLAVDSWQVQPSDHGCVLSASERGNHTARQFMLGFDEQGRPAMAGISGDRPDAPIGEGVPAAWSFQYSFSGQLPALPSVPPAALPADDQTVLAMLAANDAPGSSIIWRARSERDQIHAFRGPQAYGFVAWDAEGNLTEAAVLDRPAVAAELLEFYRLGELADESDDELYLVAIVLDEQVTELALDLGAKKRQRIAISAPGGLIGPLDDYPEDWRFYYADGRRVPLPARHPH